MTNFGERAGAASYSRDRLIKRQVRSLRVVAEFSNCFPDAADFSERTAQAFIDRMIILEQFPRTRISSEEMPKLRNLLGLMRGSEGDEKIEVLKEVSRVSTNA